MSRPVGFMLGFVGTPIHRTMKRWTFVGQVLEQFVLEMLGHMLNLEHRPIFTLKLFATNLANLGTRSTFRACGTRFAGATGGTSGTRGSTGFNQFLFDWSRRQRLESVQA